MFKLSTIVKCHILAILLCDGLELAALTELGEVLLVRLQETSTHATGLHKT